MHTEVVPAFLLFDYSNRGTHLVHRFSSDLRMYLITKIYEAEDPKWKRSGSARFFTFDNIGVGDNAKCRVTGWVGACQPETVVRIPRLLAIDMVRDLYSAYPLFSESFYRSVNNAKGHEAGVFSRTL